MESFTNSNLVELALNGDREAIVEVSGLVSIRLRLPNGRLSQGFCHIGRGFITPNGAFEWRKRGLREALKDELRLTLYISSLGDVSNDADLHRYVLAVLRGLLSGREPNEAFKWQQNRGRRIENCNALRDWDICVTVLIFMRKGFSFTKSCDMVADITSLNYKSIQAIARLTTADIEPVFPCNIYPLPKSKLIQQSDIDKMVYLYENKATKTRFE